ncbi:MAG: hypothetical protein ABIQ35_10955, partial [Verrucomicrobiota bacterium]
AMTFELIKVFPKQGGTFQIEPDASSGSYFWAASDPQLEQKSEGSTGNMFTLSGTWNSTVKVFNWPATKWQIDANFPLHLARLTMHRLPLFGSQQVIGIEKDISQLLGGISREEQDPEYQKYLEQFDSQHGQPKISRKNDLGDSVMTAIVLAPLCYYSMQFTELSRLRVQECERVVALRTELTKCGAKAIEEGDTLTVYPSQLHGAEIETYNDHRMAMCFSILGLKVPGIKIKNPACVKKTFPNFFQKLAARPPHGLGAKILDGKTGRTLTHEELFAD